MSTFINPDGEVAQEGSCLDLNSSILTTDTITAYELAYKYKKCVTALVNGKYVGWGYSPNFIRFKYLREEEDNISEITFWHEYPSGEFCRYHCFILIACGGYDPKQFYSDRLSELDNKKYFTSVRGESLFKSKIQKIKFRHIYDKSGFLINKKYADSKT